MSAPVSFTTEVCIAPALAGVPPSRTWQPPAQGQGGAPRLVACALRVVDAAGLHLYEGLFRSSCDAVIDAIERFPAAHRISTQTKGLNT